MDMYCYNQASIFISNNLMFQEHAKHIEVNGNFIQNSLIKKQIDTHHYFYLHLPIKQKKKKKSISIISFNWTEDCQLYHFKE